MDVDDAVAIRPDHLLRDHHKEACQHDEIRPGSLYRLQQRLVKQRPALIVFRRNTAGCNSGCICPFQCISACIIADDRHDLGVGDGAVCNGIDDGLQIRAAAGHKHSYFQHTVTPFSPASV